MSDEWMPLSNDELNWLAWGIVLGILSQNRTGNEVAIEPRGPFGEFFMRKSGLRMTDTPCVGAKT